MKPIQHPRYNNNPIAVSPDLAILRVSKATSSEALKVLFDKSVFVFKLDFTRPTFYEEIPRETAALMKHVWFEVSTGILGSMSSQGGFFCKIGGLTKQELMAQRTSGLFTGTTCLRNMMRIKFMNCTLRRTLCMPHIFFKAMNDLGGFQNLVVEFEFPCDEEPDDLTRELGERLRDFYLKETFEPVYGPAVQHTEHSVGKYTYYLRFRPRQNLTARLITRAGKMLEEAARLSDRPAATDSLPDIIETLKGL